jgi:uroporphyrinogen-III synthase
LIEIRQGRGAGKDRVPLLLAELGERFQLITRETVRCISPVTAAQLQDFRRAIYHPGDARPTLLTLALDLLLFWLAA